LFRAHEVSVSFGGVTACNGIDLELNDGEIVAVVGPNGSGKTSLCDALGGYIERDTRRRRLSIGPRSGPTVAGRVYFGEHDVSGLAAHQRSALGMARTFEHPTLFESMPVIENLMTARHSHMRGGFFSCGLGLALSKHEERLARAHAGEILEMLGIEALAAVPVAGLPAGLRRTVELGRALTGDPRLVVMDEPAAGLRPKERRELSERIGMVCDEMGVAVLVTDQDLPFVASLADYVYVLETGTVIGQGEPGEVERNPRVQATYLRAPELGEA
jgi:ABC-type branched-subunit amino acid transport system ATPase component